MAGSWRCGAGMGSGFIRMGAESGDAWREHAAPEFRHALAGKEPLRAPVRYGVLLSALMDAMYISAAGHSVVSVKPVPDDI